MEKKKFMNGTEFGSKSEHATKSSSAPDGAATGFVPLDDDSLASVTGGRDLLSVASSLDLTKYEAWIDVYTKGAYFTLEFASTSDTRIAEAALAALAGQNVSSRQILDSLGAAGVRPTNVAAFSLFWDGVSRIN